MMAVKRLLIVINPISGGRSKVKLREYLTSECEAQGLAFDFFETSGDNDLAKLKIKFDMLKPSAVVAVGGDGTANLVGNLLSGTQVPMGIIPHGSANALAKELGIPTSVPEALRIILQGKTAAIDTLTLNGKYVFHIADIGFNARIVKLFSESTLRGMFMYIYLSIKEFFRYRSSVYQVITPGQNYSGRAFMIAITNCKGFATNLNVNPEGKIDDGLFEISIIKDFPKSKTFNILYKLFNNTIGHSPYNEIIQAKEATLINPHNRRFNIDGEHASLGKKVEIRIKPASLVMLVG